MLSAGVREGEERERERGGGGGGGGTVVDFDFIEMKMSGCGLVFQLVYFTKTLAANNYPTKINIITKTKVNNRISKLRKESTIMITKIVT